MNREDGYMSLEAALVLPFAFMIILLVIRLWFFRYDSVLQEMDVAAVVVRALEQQNFNSEEKAEYVISQMQGRYKEHYISWEFGDIHTVCSSDKVECSVTGQCPVMPGGRIFEQLGRGWTSSVTRSRTSVSEVFVIRTYRKAMAVGNMLSDES